MFTRASESCQNVKCYLHHLKHDFSFKLQSHSLLFYDVFIWAFVHVGFGQNH